MNTAEQYTTLNRKLSSLREELAVLTSKEASKAETRETLIAELMAAGVDPSKPMEELARLESEVQADLSKASEEVSAFEAALRAAKNPTPTAQVSAPAATTPTPEPLPKPQPSSDPIDDLDLS